MNEEFLSCFIHPEHALVLSCIRITKRSSRRMDISLFCTFVISKNASVTSGKTFQVSHAIYFLLPLKEGTVSHPVNAWNANRPENVVADNEETIS